MNVKKELDEPELENDYPIYANYLYVVDGEVVRSHFHGITVKELKQRVNAKSVTRCDIGGRGLWDYIA